MSATTQSDPLPFIQTKLYRQPVSADIVCRPRLHEILDQGRESSLTLVSAPAGYGKSMLVSHWAESLADPCAWLSLDNSDSDLREFARYLVAAITAVFPGRCDESASLAGSSGPLSIPMLGVSLINEIEKLETDFVLVLDDYHRLATKSEVHELIQFIMEHPPRSLNLVLVTRTDPPLPLAFMRAGHHVTQVRLRDLQFTRSETAAFLARFADLESSDSALTNLQRQTEGWVVGLRLVALYLRHVEDPDAFLCDLEGGIQLTQEYLLQEVLANQPPEIRPYILRAAILDRFCAEILDAVCGSGDGAPSGREILKHLQMNNLFTISLDAKGEWFRYHHLFQELLRDYLRRDVAGAEIVSLHGRVSQWFENQGLITEAIEHALKAGDSDRAAEIVERYRFAEFESDRWYVVERWLALLPADIKETRPRLVLTQAWVAYSQILWERVVPLIEQVASLLEDKSDSPDILAELAFFKGYLQYWSGEAEESLRSLEYAKLYFSGSESFAESQIQIHLGFSRCMAGERERAIEEFRQRIESVAVPDGQFACHLIGGLSFVHLLSGDLLETRTEAQRLHRMAADHGYRMTAAWGSYLLGCTHLHAGSLDAAVEHLTRAAEARFVLDTVAAIDAIAGLALAQQLRGQEDAAAATTRLHTDFAGQINDQHCLTVVESTAARLAVARGEPASAMNWARTAPGTAGPGELFFWIESPAITRARVLIASGTTTDLEQARESLDEIRRVCEACRFTGQIVEVAVLQALALDRQGHESEALQALQEALDLAEAGPWVRPFVEAEPFMSRKLQRLVARGGTEEYVQRFLVARGGAGEAGEELSAPEKRSASTTVPELHPDDALTNRELDVLELLARRLRNQEIANQLCISTHTVNFHLKQIYQKLDVHGRHQAVDRAIELGILDLRSRP